MSLVRWARLVAFPLHDGAALGLHGNFCFEDVVRPGFGHWIMRGKVSFCSYSHSWANFVGDFRLSPRTVHSTKPSRHCMVKMRFSAPCDKSKWDSKVDDQPYINILHNWSRLNNVWCYS